MPKRTTIEKINIFKFFFTGLLDVYGTYDPKTNQSAQIKKPVTDDVIYDHLTGKQPYGVYLLDKKIIKAIAVDFDTDDRLIPYEYQQLTNHYEIESHIERSKSKGYHVWTFFDHRGVLAYKARLIIQHFLEEIEQPDTEIFPKQDRLNGPVQYGNFINAPLFGSLVPKKRTVFIDPKTFRPYQNQWDLLESVKRHTEKDLDNIIELNELSRPEEANDFDQATPSVTNSHTLPICAQNMFQQGVTQYQRLSCFRLAVHLKRVGLPYDLAVSALLTWAEKNKPSHGKRIITTKEIKSQTLSAYKKDYQGYGCRSEAVLPFCEPNCPVNILRKNG